MEGHAGVRPSRSKGSTQFQQFVQRDQRRSEGRRRLEGLHRVLQRRGRHDAGTGLEARPDHQPGRRLPRHGSQHRRLRHAGPHRRHDVTRVPRWLEPGHLGQQRRTPSWPTSCSRSSSRRATSSSSPSKGTIPALKSLLGGISGSEARRGSGQGRREQPLRARPARTGQPSRPAASCPTWPSPSPAVPTCKTEAAQGRRRDRGDPQRLIVGAEASTRQHVEPSERMETRRHGTRRRTSLPAVGVFARCPTSCSCPAIAGARC